MILHADGVMVGLYPGDTTERKRTGPDIEASMLLRLKHLTVILIAALHHEVLVCRYVKLRE